MTSRRRAFAERTLTALREQALDVMRGVNYRATADSRSFDEVVLPAERKILDDYKSVQDAIDRIERKAAVIWNDIEDLTEETIATYQIPPFGEVGM